MENFLAHATRGSLRPIDPLFTSAGIDKGVYSPGLLEAVSFNDELLAVPLMFSTVVMVYNMDLFDEAGAAYPTADWTWADSLEAAKKISALGDDIWGMYRRVCPDHQQSGKCCHPAVHARQSLQASCYADQRRAG